MRSDADSVFRVYANDPRVTRYLNWSPVADLAEARQGMEHRLARMDSGEEYSWVICLRETSELIGMIAVRPKDMFLELGYVLGTAFWGQGYATEAVGLIKAWAQTEQSIFRLWAACAVDNRASIHVLEKCGFRNEGVLHDWAGYHNTRGENSDCYCFAWMRG